MVPQQEREAIDAFQQKQCLGAHGRSQIAGGCIEPNGRDELEEHSCAARMADAYPSLDAVLREKALYPARNVLDMLGVLCVAVGIGR